MKRHTHDRLARYRQIARETPLLRADEERELIEQFRAGSNVALQHLLDAHLRLVLSVAKRYACQGTSMEDLISEGNLGLLEAARRFSSDRGTRFGTYAAWWVRSHVRRFAFANRRIVGTPSTRNARRVISGLRKTQRLIAQREGRCAARTEVAEALGVPEEDVALVEAALGCRDSVVGPLDDGTIRELPDKAPTPEQLTAALELRDYQRAQVKTALEALSEREREIVRRRYLCEDTETLAILGESLGLSRERVRQIEKRAQMKLRSALLSCVA